MAFSPIALTTLTGRLLKNLPSVATPTNAGVRIGSAHAILKRHLSVNLSASKVESLQKVDSTAVSGPGGRGLLEDTIELFGLAFT